MIIMINELNIVPDPIMIKIWASTEFNWFPPWAVFFSFFNGRPGSDRAPRLGWSMQGSACQRVCASLRPSCPLAFVLKAGGNGEGLVGLMLRENILPGRTTLFIIPERMQEIDCDRSEWSHLFSDARESSI